MRSRRPFADPAHRPLVFVVVLTALVAVLVAGGAVAGLAAVAGGPFAPTPVTQPSARAPVSGFLRAAGGPYLTDRWGRVVFLHGVNAVDKRPPFELFDDPGQPWSFSPSDAARIASLGFNVVRLGIIWQGIEPGTLGPNNPRVCTPGPPHDPGQFNPAIASAYLDRVARTVAILARAHVYTLLDLHEDVYSSAFGGEGAPLWAVCTNGLPIGHLPGRWSNTYRDPALDVAVHHFWTNDVHGDLQGEYLRVWKLVAQRFRGDPWVVGYDPINEPFTRTVTVSDPFTSPARDPDPQVARDLECLYTGRAHPGRSELDGAIVHCPPQVPEVGLIRTLQSADPVHPVFFEPDIFTSRGRPNDVGAMNLPNLVFNFHVYCGYRNPVTGNPTDVDECARQELRTMRRRVEEQPDIASAAQPKGPALFMSEFGATSSTSLMTSLTADADSLEIGWIYWAWKYYDDPTGSTDEALVTASGAYVPTVAELARTYPVAVAGMPTSFSFDPKTAAFRFVYRANPAVAAPTLIFVPVAIHYPTGYCAAAVDAAVVSAPGATNLVVRNDPGDALVTVTVRTGSC